MATKTSENASDEFMAQLRQREAAELLERIEHKELLTGDELQERLGVGSEAISEAVKSGGLFVVAGPGGLDYYPAFFADARYDRRSVERVSKALGDLPATVKYHFFTSKSHRLGRVTPLDALADGRLAEALVAAQGFAER